MMGRSHFLLAGAAWAALAIRPIETPVGTLSAPVLRGPLIQDEPAGLLLSLLVAAACGLAPDLDKAGSTAARSLGIVTRVLSWGIERGFGHRKAFHSLVGVALGFLAGEAGPVDIALMAGMFDVDEELSDNDAALHYLVTSADEWNNAMALDNDLPTTACGTDEGFSAGCRYELIGGASTVHGISVRFGAGTSLGTRVQALLMDGTLNELATSANHTVSEEVRFVQITPPGSACSIAFGKGISPMEPGSLDAVQIVIPDADAALKLLTDKGVDAQGVDQLDWGRFVSFRDPDGNRFTLQELPPRP